MVPEEGVEPSRLTAPDPKSGVSTNSTTRAMTLSLFLDIFKIDFRQDRKMFCTIDRFHPKIISLSYDQHNYFRP